jgi:hypothetical protein
MYGTPFKEMNFIYPILYDKDGDEQEGGNGAKIRIEGDKINLYDIVAISFHEIKLRISQLFI